MSEIMDIRLQHHLAQEFYRQQMLQRIPGKFFNIFSFPLSLHIFDQIQSNKFDEFTLATGNQSSNKSLNKFFK